MKINGKPVRDAKKPMRISISENDASLGKSRDPGGCAAARAILRVTKDASAARVHIGRTYIEYPTHWVRYLTPESLKTEIVSFDRGAPKSYAEGNYTLKAPAPTERLGVRLPKPTGKTGSKKRRPHIAKTNHHLYGVRRHGANR